MASELYKQVLSELLTVPRCPNRPPSPPTHILVPVTAISQDSAIEFAEFLLAKEAAKKEARRIAEQKEAEEAAAKKSEQECHHFAGGDHR